MTVAPKDPYKEGGEALTPMAREGRLRGNRRWWPVAPTDPKNHCNDGPEAGNHQAREQGQKQPRATPRRDVYTI